MAAADAPGHGEREGRGVTLAAVESLRLAATASDLLFREAHCLDSRQWDEWLALYSEQCEFWVPAWKSEDVPTADPNAELSLIYYPSRAGLEERVWRVKSGRSIASRPLPRTQHQVTNVRVIDARPPLGSGEPNEMRVAYQWCVNQFAHKIAEVQVFFGHAEADLVHQDGAWRFARKKILLLNDYILTKLDFYNV